MSRPPMQNPEEIEIHFTSDKTRMQLSVICDFLAQSHWAAHRPRSVIERSLQNSECYGAFVQGRQVGFARVVTDHCTFAYLCDVFVDKQLRGRGIAKGLLELILSNPDLANLRRFVLATRDAHSLYLKYGFEPLSPTAELRYMERMRLDPAL